MQRVVDGELVKCDAGLITRAPDILTSRQELYKLSDRQAKVFTTPATEIWFGGAVGGGKSHLLRVLGITLCFHNPHLTVFMFRRKRPDLIRSHMKGPTSFPVMLRKPVKMGICKIVKDEIRFANGSTILFCHCKDESDITNYLSTDMHVILNDEVSEFTEYMYRMQRSRSRAPKSLRVPKFWRGRIPLMVNASNPGGNLHAYLKANFYDPHPPETIWRTKKSDGGRLRTFIPSKLRDNKHLDHEEYEGNVIGLGNPELVKMYLDGDMNVVLGAYFKEFGAQHICEPFTIPDRWQRYRAIDWGFADHHCCLWAAVSDGRIEGIDKGCLVIYREQYDNEMVATDAAKRVATLSAGEHIVATVMDPSAFNMRSKVVQGPTIAEEFAKHGVPLRMADNARVAGWMQIRQRLQFDQILIFNTCRNLIRTLPLLEYDELKVEDAKEKGVEDHAPDTLRYLCMARPIDKRYEENRNKLRGIMQATYEELEYYEG